MCVYGNRQEKKPVKLALWLRSLKRLWATPYTFMVCALGILKGLICPLQMYVSAVE